MLQQVYDPLEEAAGPRIIKWCGVFSNALTLVTEVVVRSRETYITSQCASHAVGSFLIQEPVL